MRQIYRQVKHEDGVDAETDRRQVKMVSRHGRGGVDNEADDVNTVAQVPAGSHPEDRVNLVADEFGARLGVQADFFGGAGSGRGVFPSFG